VQAECVLLRWLLLCPGCWDSFAAAGRQSTAVKRTQCAAVSADSFSSRHTREATALTIRSHTPGGSRAGSRPRQQTCAATATAPWLALPPQRASSVIYVGTNGASMSMGGAAGAQQAVGDGGKGTSAKRACSASHHANPAALSLAAAPNVS